ERGGVVDRQLRQNLAVNLHLGGLQALDESVVGHAVGASRGVDPGDPELPEVALTRPAVPVGVVERMQRLLLGLAVQPGALPAVALCLLKNRATLLLGVHCPLDACHGSILSNLGGGSSPRGGSGSVGRQPQRPSSFRTVFTSALATSP